MSYQFLIESDLKWEFGIFGEEEETFAAKSEDPIMQKIWKDKIPVQAINVDKVFNGTHALINWVNIKNESYFVTMNFLSNVKHFRKVEYGQLCSLSILPLLGSQ